jgi:hypothetical protein
VVRGEHIAPGAVRHPRRHLGRAHDVGEQDRRQDAVEVDLCPMGGGEEPLDRIQERFLVA